MQFVKVWRCLLLRVFCCEGLALLDFLRVSLWKNIKDGVAQKGRSEIILSVRTEIRVDPKSDQCEFVGTDLYEWWNPIKGVHIEEMCTRFIWICFLTSPIYLGTPSY